MPAERRLAPGVFVTGTDTGVGKTLVAAALARHLRDQGLRVAVMKPVETGVADPNQAGPDAALLRWAAGCQAPWEDVAPLRLRRPLAPALAAEKDKVFVDFSALVETCQRLRRNHDFVIVEGAGGLMVPLAGGLLIADLARAMELPLLVVCRPDLGTINHTLLTVFSAQTMEIPVCGFLINGMPDAPDEAMGDAPHALAALASTDLLGVLDRVDAADEQAKVEALAGQIAQLPTYRTLRYNLAWPSEPSV
ncbi:dethiobiotin synthase [Geoalkalibacter halelectricus]|uniref:ATP-dependent dethiobiotin synthetase BioD n=1 Tax=Geoalkalibacter halelectricus TaxID=2847045 RepID=A0ABY5ZPI5_9BACT|nr:dethiobiotin synthase [Geoalkalibacter halelectricus]MDO3379930.1 dethiobiotin synthase [Geoalkalibacter halelectricus]UWZ80543.1 dethiobiotin synthase [Geoalkalibacter halelectricus]